MTTQLREELATLSKEELLELRRRITASLPKKEQIAMLSGGEDRMTQEDYDKFVSMQLESYRQEQMQKRQQAVAKEPAAQAAG